MPPASGMAAPSSARDSAPASDNTPPTIQTRNRLRTLPTSSATLWGTRKIPDPMIVPTTMAVEPRYPMARTVGELSDEGAPARQVLCDVRKQRQVGRMVEQVVRWHGKVDVLMYIAGVGKTVPFTRTDERHWDWTVETNLKGAFLAARAVAPHMIKRRRGKLVFMASTNSWDAEAELAPYNVSKAGVFLLAKTLSRELGPYGINSNAVGPGLIRTRLTAPMLKDRKFMRKYHDLIPLGRVGEPEDIAGPAA